MVLNGKNFREIKCNCWSVEDRKRECDKTGVDIQVSIISYHCCSSAYQSFN